MSEPNEVAWDSTTYRIELQKVPGVNGALYYQSKCSCGSARILGCDMKAIEDAWTANPKALYPSCAHLRY